MSYPHWDVPTLGGGLLMAIVAIIHVFISQFAVGGGIFLALAGRKAYQAGDRPWLAYLRKHTKVFLLMSVLFGAVTGVGIWFTIGLISPFATSILIRTFVWGWAIEWCFFLIEITALLLYYYGWDRISVKTHQMLAWIYAGASYLTLVVINGIVSFMLTPGSWLENQSFWAGVFNPGYFPQLVMRTAASLALAGVYGLVTAAWNADADLKERLVHYISKFLLTAFALFPIGAVWLLFVVSPLSRELALGGAAPVALMNAFTLILSAIILGATYFGPFRKPFHMTKTFAGVILALALLTTGGAEWVREGIRKPFIIYDYMYSNGVFADQPKFVEGVMSNARWSLYGSVKAAPSILAAGDDLFRLQCSSCHTVSGYNGVKSLVKGWNQEFAASQIDRLNMLKGYMPPFMGTLEERDALAAYLVSINAKEASSSAAAQR
jgi:cytochrome bd-type quinol oxidase subunit 1